MYSREVNWLLGTEDEQRRAQMKNAVLTGEQRGSSARASNLDAEDGNFTHGGNHTAVFFDADVSRLASDARGSGGDGGVSDAIVLNGLVRRGPREPAENFSAIPARYM